MAKKQLALPYNPNSKNKVYKGKHTKKIGKIKTEPGKNRKFRDITNVRTDINHKNWKLVSGKWVPDVKAINEGKIKKIPDKENLVFGNRGKSNKTVLAKTEKYEAEEGKTALFKERKNGGIRFKKNVETPRGDRLNKAGTKVNKVTYIGGKKALVERTPTPTEKAKAIKEENKYSARMQGLKTAITNLGGKKNLTIMTMPLVKKFINKRNSYFDLVQKRQSYLGDMKNKLESIKSWYGKIRNTQKGRSQEEAYKKRVSDLVTKHNTLNQTYAKKIATAKKKAIGYHDAAIKAYNFNTKEIDKLNSLKKYRSPMDAVYENAQKGLISMMKGKKSRVDIIEPRAHEKDPSKALRTSQNFARMTIKVHPKTKRVLVETRAELDQHKSEKTIANYYHSFNSIASAAPFIKDVYTRLKNKTSLQGAVVGKNIPFRTKQALDFGLSSAGYIGGRKYEALKPKEQVALKSNITTDWLKPVVGTKTNPVFKPKTRISLADFKKAKSDYAKMEQEEWMGKQYNGEGDRDTGDERESYGSDQYND